MEKTNSNGLATPFWWDLRIGLVSSNNGPYPRTNTNILFSEDTRSKISPLSELCQLQADELKSHEAMTYYFYGILQKHFVLNSCFTSVLCNYNTIHVTSSKQLHELKDTNYTVHMNTNNLIIIFSHLSLIIGKYATAIKQLFFHW